MVEKLYSSKFQFQLLINLSLTNGGTFSPLNSLGFNFLHSGNENNNTDPNGLDNAVAEIK